MGAHHIFVAAIGLCLLGPAAPPPRRLRVDIVFDGLPMPRRLEASAMDEVTSIWAAYGVDVRASGPGDRGQDRVVVLAVVLTNRPDEQSATEALGSIQFLGDLPEPRIAIYPNTIARLVATVTLSGHDEHGWPAGFRHAILGRVMGRALAHEIGHFLLQSQHHSPAGLMRSVQAISALVAFDRRRFVLSEDEAARIASYSRGE